MIIVYLVLSAIPFLKKVPEEFQASSAAVANRTAGNLPESEKNDTINDVRHAFLYGATQTVNSTIQSDTVDEDFWTVKALYPLTGSYPLVMAGAFFLYFIVDWSKERENSNNSGEAAFVETACGAAAGSESWETWCTVANIKQQLVEWSMVLLLALFFFVYIGLEVCFNSFLAVFCVKCKLGK